MNKLLGFIGPLVKGVVSPLLGVVGKAVGKVDDGAKVVAGLSDENPKKSGVIALALGYLGVDPGAIQSIGTWLVTIGTWIQAL